MNRTSHFNDDINFKFILTIQDDVLWNVYHHESPGPALVKWHHGKINIATGVIRSGM